MIPESRIGALNRKGLAPARQRFGGRQSSAAFRPGVMRKRQRAGAVQNLAAVWTVHGEGGRANHFPSPSGFPFSASEGEKVAQAG